MAQDFKTRFESFKNKFKEAIDRWRGTILISMFLYGLKKRGYFYIRDFPEYTREFVEMLAINESVKKQIDVSILLKVENAEDESGNSDLDYIKPGKEELEYILKRSLAFSRPDYSLFFVLGMIRGSLNGGSIDRFAFIDLLQNLPPEFVVKYGSEIVDFNNFFDETDCKIDIDTKTNKIQLRIA
jgi:hypothetical protein